ncbi:MAG: 4Fe-4S dicluster domain-containing protein [Coriobacteriales bacterium]|jgi:molybdopterin-containing oxidoreductase family iron-sulfur binding subunit|nr:4Fe-4S dicluster domain-containing protein [Coriobacteriales bacterium]
MAEKRYGFVLSSKDCIGCQFCATRCKVENNLPNGIWWNRILTEGGLHMDTPSGEYPRLKMSYFQVACQHCDNPACVKACPVGATYKDAETGVVRQDYDRCLGCRMCLAACPYTGVRSFNWEEPKYSVDFAVGDKDVPAHQKHVVEKCTMCWHRTARGEQPACVADCPGRARHWGDLNDPDSEVSQLLVNNAWIQLQPEKGTEPSVYYLV